MNFFFDHYNKFEVPNFTLANPDGTELYSLGQITERSLELRFNALSKLTFNAPKVIDGTEVPYYDLLEYRRIVKVENIGNFMIIDVEIDNDGMQESKKITCQSMECELNFKKLSLFKGYHFLWGFGETNQTILGIMLQYAPGWSIGYVSPQLTTNTRYFNVTDTSIYAFLTTQVSQSFQCIFVFDGINKVINAYASSEATTNTDIFLSYDNLVEKTNIKEITSELVTALNVYGGNNLGINVVNPLGSNTIYNFNYYKTTDWMTAGLITALGVWETKVDTNQITYANTLSTLKDQNSILLAKQSQLATLEAELTSLTNIQSVRIQQGLDIVAINAQILAKQTEVNAKNSEIAGVNATIVALNATLSAIHNDLSFENNFTPTQITELDSFIIGSTYTNTNFIMQDGASGSSVQQQAQFLYDQAQEVLTKVSEPRYTFSVDAINFVFLKEFQTFINQLVLGAVVTIEFSDGHYVYPALLGMDFSYDDPTQFKLTFSNRLRLDDSEFQFSDLFNQAVNSGITTTFNSEVWSDWNNNYKDDVSTFITSSLDAARNAVTSGSNQEFIINANGLRGRVKVDSGAYGPEQFWFINNLLAFTDDNWSHAKLALGRVQTSSGSAFGIISEKVTVKTLDFSLEI